MLLKPWELPLPLEEFLSAYAQTVEAMFCSASSLTHLPSLCFVVISSVGLNHIDLLECRRLGIAVANAVDIFSADVADLALGSDGFFTNLLPELLDFLEGRDRRGWVGLSC
ncbi:PREDICTED: glyoxylate/hydroxypyruvate reductase HPR3-like [Ipomoea nil]|uniref:glyoxylate/hydroxypyruvate reductase HPR3-like n=1 Tax=Ipomoea nil TaxID=35883 RepID=UPI00090170F0|nr:PREDICTED: glyoxylate/hydroxypyruvate reductase HPR3-like [Ipomoea nil]